MAGWTLFSKARVGRETEIAVTPELPHSPEEPARFLTRGPLDEVGQQSEQVRERINSLALRLDDLKSLADDFGQIVQPVHDFVIQHSHAQSRLMETEALLQRERELSQQARGELQELHQVATRHSSDLAAATAELKGYEERLRDQDAQVIQLRLRLDDQTAAVGSLEKQLESESERSQTLAEDNATLRADIDSL